jgi:hypothetical protein
MTSVSPPRIPNFFIVGAPKCGTTGLYHYLKQHPDIFMPERKEPNFFCADLEISRAIRDSSAYLRLFAQAGAERRLGEASVWYLFSRRAASAIKSFNPDALIIAMLRNPVEMLYALHSQRFLSGYDDIAEFRTALARSVQDRSGEIGADRADRLMQAPFCPQIGHYGEQIERYLSLFGEDRVRIIIYEDFKNDTARIYRETLDFLQVENVFLPEFKIINANVQVRSKFLHRMVGMPPPPVRQTARALVPRPVRQFLAAKISERNARTAPRAPMPLDLRRSLQAEFARDVEKLSTLLRRDLSSWLND